MNDEPSRDSILVRLEDPDPGTRQLVLIELEHGGDHTIEEFPIV